MLAVISIVIFCFSERVPLICTHWILWEKYEVNHFKAVLVIHLSFVWVRNLLIQDYSHTPQQGLMCKKCGQSYTLAIVVLYNISCYTRMCFQCYIYETRLYFVECCMTDTIFITFKENNANQSREMYASTKEFTPSGLTTILHLNYRRPQLITCFSR